MDIKAIVVGLVLIAVSASMAVDTKKRARAIVQYYHRIPEGKWGPRWLRWQWRPSERQSLIAAWVFTAIGFAAGFTFLLAGLI